MVLLVALVVLVIVCVAIVVSRVRTGTSDIEDRVEVEGSVCPTCGEIFDTPDDLTHHVREFHQPAARQ
jgi:hypothetical protein